MAQPVILTSFGAGELSKSLFARVDLDKYHVGAALLRNFFVDYRGGATTRPGTQFIARTHPNPGGGSGIARLIPFTLSTITTYILEFGWHYVRFYNFGGQVLEASQAVTAVTQATPGVFTDNAHGYSNGQEIFASGFLGMTLLNGKNFLIANATANTFTLTDLSGNPISTAAYPAYLGGGTVARVYTLTTPYSDSDLAKLKYVQSADTLTLTHPSYPPADLTRTSPSSFAYNITTIGPITQPPTSLTVTAKVAGTNNYGYTVTAINQAGIEESIMAVPKMVGSAILDQTAGKTIKITWTPVPGQIVTGYNVYKWGPIPNTDPASTAFGYIGQTQSTSFTDANIAADFSKVPPQFADPFSQGEILSVSPTAPGAGYAPPYVALQFTGDGTGAAGYGVVDPATGGIIAAFMTLNGKNYTNCVTTAPGGAATFSTQIGPESGIYPSCASYIQQRRCYAGPPNSPELIDMSTTGIYTNFNTTPTSQDNDAIQVSLAGREVNAIVSMVPMSTGLIVLTTGGAFLVTGGGPGQPITPSSITAAAQASFGASDLPPIIVNYDLLYVQSKGTTVRDFAFNFYVQSYYGYDRSSLASHLFTGHQIKEWAWSYEPNKIVWCVRDDGVLLALTYVPEQEVYAWSRHDTFDGQFVSVAAVSEGQTEATYFIVKRIVNNQFVQYVERLHQETFDMVWDAWCVDAGLQYPLNFPNANLFPAAPQGNAVIFTADQPVFTAANVGDMIWTASGQAQVTVFTDALHVTCNILQSLSFPNGRTFQIPPGQWSIVTPTNVVINLDHLNGLTVTGLADGLVIPPTVVVNGQLNIGLLGLGPASKITVGLGFQAQLQTLYLDTGEPTIQGRRKFLPRVTMILNQSRGLKIGQTFDRLAECEYPVTAPMVTPQPLFEGDFLQTLFSDWTVEGQICVQQDYPLPSSVLGLIPEVVIGDTPD